MVLLFSILWWYLRVITFAYGLPSVSPGVLTCGYDACPKYDPHAINIHLVAHSHNDVGWLKTVEDYYYQATIMKNSLIRFVQVETAYLAKWWGQQDVVMKQNVKDLINNGQLEIVNGGWTINDEGAVHYQSVIDQYTLGLKFIEDNFGKCGRPKVAWQLDTLGHSREQASISAQIGFDGIFFDRLDYREIERREKDKTTEILWRGSHNLGNTSDIFASIIYKGYKSPDGFCFDISCRDEAIVGDEATPLYNYKAQVEKFSQFIREQASKYPTNNILVTMGEDFSYKSALSNFINMDRLIKGFELFPQFYFDKRPLRVFYSTPSCYIKSVHEFIANTRSSLIIESNDFFPLVELHDQDESYYTGYFTSRPNSKRFERHINNYLQVAKQLGALALPLDTSAGPLEDLKKAMGIMQHHNAITGTEKQIVSDNYHYLLAKPLEDADMIIDYRITMSLSDGAPLLLDLKSCFLMNISQCPGAQSDKFAVAIYNPLSRMVSAAIHIPVNWQHYTVFDTDGTPIQPQIADSPFNFSYTNKNEAVDFNPFTLSFVAKDLPPIGLKIYKIEKHNDIFHQSKIVRKDDGLIGYDKTHIELDETSGLLKKIHMHGVDLEVSQELLYYISQNSSGAYTFKPISQELHKINNGPIVNNRRISGDVYQGVVQEFSDWAKQIIKIYKHDQSYIEIDWVIGPLNVSDGFGKEVVSKFTTPLASNKTWFTDSNGREMIKRVRKNMNIAENFYPVNTRIVLKDEEKKLELAIITDRTQGGSSLQDGNLEVMVHRACVDKDILGETLNEQQYGQGVVVRGQHYLVLGKSGLQDVNANSKTLGGIQREIALKKNLAPWSFFTESKNFMKSQLNFLKISLPDTVNILSLETWSEDRILIRLEYILENDDVNVMSSYEEVAVNLEDLFVNFVLIELEEMTLAANMKLKDDVRFVWPNSEEFDDRFGSLNINNRLSRGLQDFTISLAPMQIRTFLAKIKKY